MKAPRSLLPRSSLARAVARFGTLAAMLSAPFAVAQVTPITPLPQPQQPFQLINLSARAKLGAGQTLVAGFIVSGTAPARVLVRGIGPSLTQFGVTDAMSDPKIQLTSVVGNSSISIHNDNWSDASNLLGSTDKMKQLPLTSFEGGAFPLLVGSKDGAMLFELSPGAYTMTVAGNTDTMSGTVLAEVYDVSVRSPSPTPLPSRLSNLSVRGVSSDESPLLTGFVVQGVGPNALLIRAVGPGLTAFGVTGAMADSRIDLQSATGAVVAFNDNWDATPGPLATIRQAAQLVGAFPLTAGSKDAAMVFLPPLSFTTQSSYTVRASGVNGANSIVLLEVYDVPSLLNSPVGFPSQ